MSGDSTTTAPTPSLTLIPQRIQPAADSLDLSAMDNAAHEQAPETSATAETPVFALHRGGKMEIASTVPLRDRADLSLAYTPGVAEVCIAIAENPGFLASARKAKRRSLSRVSMGVLAGD